MQINRNIFFSEALLDFLTSRKIEYAVLSPGSRNTPLTFAAAHHKKLKTFSIIDERAAGFFASGLARSTGKPVILNCTSGTAAAEYLPAVIESFFQKIPLIIITADRPAKLRGTGANQTIYQNNIYGSHVIKAWDIAPPLPDARSVKKMARVFHELAALIDRGLEGPVHLNLQFDKPFEPDAITDTPTASELNKLKKSLRIADRKRKISPPAYKMSAALKKEINSAFHVFIFCGPDAVKSKEDSEYIARLCDKFDAPVLCDAFSGISKQHQSRYTFQSFHLYADKFIDDIRPDIIFQFGNLPVSKAGEEILAMKGVTRVIVNKDGKIRGEYGNKVFLCRSDIASFTKEVIRAVKNRRFFESGYDERINALEAAAETAKRTSLESFPFTEAEIIKVVAENCTFRNPLMISNSMPPRDFDYISGLVGKQLNLYHNRGASGIDGIIASAAGIAAGSSSRTFLVIGDVSFFYDLTSLQIIKQSNLCLTIVLLNNGGGKIFDMLPVKRFPEMVKHYYHTPAGVNYRKLISALDIRYDNPKSIRDLTEILGRDFNGCNVIECKTSIKDTIRMRKVAEEEFFLNLFI
ncbi:MAG: 2-succinyl-5-enolpyruvyl-6-hydroxy-3-cyclohexene-1-carboxylate synthase [Ignavibacteriales bacterium]